MSSCHHYYYHVLFFLSSSSHFLFGSFFGWAWPSFFFRTPTTHQQTSSKVKEGWKVKVKRLLFLLLLWCAYIYNILHFKIPYIIMCLIFLHFKIPSMYVYRSICVWRHLEYRVENRREKEIINNSVFLNFKKHLSSI